MRKKETDNALELSQLIIQSIEDKKGEEIVCLDLRKINEAVADYFIICQADNVTQVKAIADYVIAQVEEKKAELPWHTEGYQNQEWILVDYVNVVVHVFLEKRRRYYQLEDLWADAKKLKLHEPEKKKKTRAKKSLKVKVVK